MSVDDSSVKQSLPSGFQYTVVGTRNRRGKRLKELCPTRGPVAACGSIEFFVRPSLDVRFSISNLHTDNLSLFR